MTTTSREQILEMVSSGKISAAEGDELLRALEAPRRSRWRLFVNPFDALPVTRALGIGLLGVIAGVALSRWRVRFDGALDVHIVRAAVSLSGAHLATGKVDSHDPPVFLMHGTADPLVAYQWALNTIDAAHKVGIGAYLTTWQGAGHVPYVQHRQEILDQTRNFLYSALDLVHAAQ